MERIFCLAASAVTASTITVPCLVIVSTLSSITLNFAIAAPRTHSLKSRREELTGETADIKAESERAIFYACWCSTWHGLREVNQTEN
jgi:hypothetical protein